MSKHPELDAAIAALGLEYSAEFVPQSRSRNAQEKHPSLNWRVTIKRGRASIVTDYMQGIGHLPDADKMRKAAGPRDFAAYERAAAESGKMGRYLPSLGITAGAKPIPAPELRDVLYCLVLDASVLDSAGFEDWASEFGYDTDSRTAEQIYRACIEQALQLRAMIGEEGLRTLRDAFQDY